MRADKLDQHPTVINFRNMRKDLKDSEVLDAEWLRKLCLDAGADDAGFVNIERAELDDQRSYILEAMPSTATLISLVFAMNREPIRSPARSIANLEFHNNYEHANLVARKIVARLQSHGVKALNPSSAFPMEMDRFPTRIWQVGHKPVAEAAGLGKMGLHRNVIHPKFGSFINLDTILISARVDVDSKPIDYNPCLTCKLCVAACPVGAIEPNGRFNFSACVTHNYREFMYGFADFLDVIADSDGSTEFREKVPDSEIASMWQSLSFKPSYKAAYCISTCPAGEDVIGDFLRDRAGFLRDVLKPLQQKHETIYVLANSDAIEHVRRFPNKTAKIIRSGMRIRSVTAFARVLPMLFQSGKAGDTSMTYSFTFTGAETVNCTVRINGGQIAVDFAPPSSFDLAVVADSNAWLQLLGGKASSADGLRAGSVTVSTSERALSENEAAAALEKFLSCFAQMVTMENSAK